MAKIAVVIEDMFEDVEYTEPADAFTDAGHELTLIGLKAGKTVEGKKRGTKVQVEKSFDQVDVGDFDALLIPGGYSPDKLRAHDKPVAFVRDFVLSGKPVFMICHAAQLLITANVLNDRKVTGWKSVKQDIINAGANFVDEEVVIDDNIVSSRSPRDLPAFISASLDKLKEID